VVWAYFDTSALVKRYVDEAGRAELLRLLRRHEVVASAILPIELRSALRQRVSEGSLDAARLPQIIKRLSADRAYWTLIGVSTGVLTAAESLAATHPVRTLDAVHVASAQIFRDGLSLVDLLFVSADQRQTETAAAVGLSVKRVG